MLCHISDDFFFIDLLATMQLHLLLLVTLFDFVNIFFHLEFTLNKISELMHKRLNKGRGKNENIHVFVVDHILGKNPILVSYI